MATQSPIMLADGAPSVGRHKSLITLTATSGGAPTAYAITANEALALACQLTRVVENAESAEVVRFQTLKR